MFLTFFMEPHIQPEILNSELVALLQPHLHPRPLHLASHILGKFGAPLLLQKVVLLQGVQNGEQLPGLALVELRRIPVVEEGGQVRCLRRAEEGRGGGLE